jgi:hypothetical protein
MSDKNKNITSVAIYFGGVMITVYIALGVVFLFTDMFYELLPDPNKRMFLGGFILLYAGFRTWMTYRLIKSRKAQQ